MWALLISLIDFWRFSVGDCERRWQGTPLGCALPPAGESLHKFIKAPVSSHDDDDADDGDDWWGSLRLLVTRVWNFGFKTSRFWNFSIFFYDIGNGFQIFLVSIKVLVSVSKKIGILEFFVFGLFLYILDPKCWTLGRVEKSKNIKNLIGYCFSDGFWSIYRNWGKFFLQKNIFSIGGIGPEIWDLGLFSDFCTFFSSGKKLNSYWHCLQWL